MLTDWAPPIDPISASCSESSIPLHYGFGGHVHLKLKRKLDESCEEVRSKPEVEYLTFGMHWMRMM